MLSLALHKTAKIASSSNGFRQWTIPILKSSFDPNEQEERNILAQRERPSTI